MMNVDYIDPLNVIKGKLNSIKILTSPNPFTDETITWILPGFRLQSKVNHLQQSGPVGKDY